VVQNVFITIVTDGYMTIKYKSSYDWLERRDQAAPSLPANGPPSEFMDDQEVYLRLKDKYEGVSAGKGFSAQEPALAGQQIEDPDLKLLAGSEAKLFNNGSTGAFNKKEIKSNDT
jgi:hypothetical protein